VDSEPEEAPLRRDSDKSLSRIRIVTRKRRAGIDSHACWWSLRTIESVMNGDAYVCRAVGAIGNLFRTNSTYQ